MFGAQRRLFLVHHYGWLVKSNLSLHSGRREAKKGGPHGEREFPKRIAKGGGYPLSEDQSPFFLFILELHSEEKNITDTIGRIEATPLMI